MNVKVRYFALFREQVGVESEFADFPGGSAADLFQQMAGQHAALMPESAALVAINDEMSAWETAVADGDEVLFFPPVAGG